MSHTSPAMTPFAWLHARDTTLLLDLRSGEAAVAYWGPRLDAGADAQTLANLGQRETAPGLPAREAQITLTPLMASGFTGSPGLAGHRAGKAWAAHPRLVAIEQLDECELRLVAVDAVDGLRLVHALTLDDTTGVLRAVTTIANEGPDDYWLDHLASPVMPLQSWAREIMGYTGRWAGEFRTTRPVLEAGTWLRENRRGRTSHDAPPMVIIAEEGSSETSGRAAGFHLGATANHRLRVERLDDGRGLVEFSELLLPGEIRLRPGESYTSPELFAAVGNGGLNDLSARFHEFVRQQILPGSVASRPRPVHYNTWEALYFKHSPLVLADLATRAAAVGVERFVLDDGWFGSRRSDRAGLGDWIVSREVYPDGLAPLIAHVRRLGMEFGIWVEPEMVNPDSDLFRQHPDWVLQLPHVAQIESRHQFVLDLTRSEVSEYLYARLDALLSEHEIGYLKWDMNRDINHPGGKDGHAVASAQARAVHALIDRVRASHPDVEIESCASGGGRANYEILKRTHRIWTSDNNDALDRLRIQRGCSHFFPPEVMGSHVGPRDCHITGRRISMEMRAGVALWGHMGLELDLRELDEAEAATLRRAIGLYKKCRSLIHRGRTVRLNMPAPLCGFGSVSGDRTQALFGCALMAASPSSLPGRYYFAGLESQQRYRLRCIWPQEDAETQELSGEALMSAGLELPLMRPQSMLIFELIAA